MQLIRGLQHITEQHRGFALTIGNFDGLHLGHQALLRLLSETAANNNCSSCLMTFEPLPKEFFNKSQPDARLMSTREKLNALQSLPDNLCPDNYLLLKFDHHLSNMTADEFIQRILIDTLDVKSLIVGDDFCFGSDRSGNFELLKKAGEQNDFDVVSLSTHHCGDMRISSTRIREALKKADFDEVEKMMGRPYTIYGRIIHGDKRGRTINFPTANIKLHRLRTPIHGVYSVTMHSDVLGDIPGVANVGSRPTVDGEHFQLEVHLFDFEKRSMGKKSMFHSSTRYVMNRNLNLSMP